MPPRRTPSPDSPAATCRTCAAYSRQVNVCVSPGVRSATASGSIVAVRWNASHRVVGRSDMTISLLLYGMQHRLDELPCKQTCLVDISRVSEPTPADDPSLQAGRTVPLSVRHEHRAWPANHGWAAGTIMVYGCT